MCYRAKHSDHNNTNLSYTGMPISAFNTQFHVMQRKFILNNRDYIVVLAAFFIPCTL